MIKMLYLEEERVDKHFKHLGIKPMNDTLLLALGELLRKEISAEQLLQEIVDIMAEQLKADRGTIFLLDSNKKELISLAGHLPELEEIRVPITQGVAGYVARTGKIVNIPYCEEDSRFWGKIDEKTGYKTRSMLAAPLRDTRGQLIGIIQFLNKKTGIFTHTDEELFIALAKQTASVLEETTLGHTPVLTSLVPQSKLKAKDPLLPLGDRFNRIIGFGSSMREIFQDIRRVAPTEATVLLRGESGTGKTLIAKAFHHNSKRRNDPFIHLDCATLPEGLMENELFGHERGAYTGAHSRQKGKVEAASGGSLFLDEIGDLPLHLQSKLLTLLQERTYSRVGSSERLHANIRIIAATNRDLEALVAQGKFREDLYYRLRVVQIELPPLRSRGREDLIHLLDYFLVEVAKRHKRSVPILHPQALTLLLNYSWPGNVREMENCIESAVIFSDNEITPQNLPLPRALIKTNPSLPAFSNNKKNQMLPSSLSEANKISPFIDEPTLEKLESRYISYLLKKHENNHSLCARILNIGRNTLLRKIKKYQLSD